MHFTKPISPNYCALNADKKTCTIYYLKDTESLIMTAKNFGVAVKSVIYEDCLAICQNLEPQYIFLPQTRGGMREKVSDFEAKFGMMQAF